MLNRFEQFTATISAIHRDIQKIERDEMEKFGLKGAYAQYLLAINRFPNGITAATVCEICDKDKAAVSRIVSEMESKGLLTREYAGSKQYRALLKLTGKGAKAARFVRERATAAVEFAGTGLTEQDRKILYVSLELIATNLQTICKNGIPASDKENES